MKEKFSVTGMSCTACSSGIAKSIARLNGVKKADVSLIGECMVVEYDEDVVSSKKIIETVKSLGYGADIFDEKQILATKAQPNKLKKRFFVSLIFLIPLLYFSMGGMIHLPQPNKIVSASIQMGLALAVIIINFKFFTSGAKALFKRMPNMDTLVSLGAGAAYIYSVVYSILIYCGKVAHNTHLFYESAAMVLALVTLGKWLEEKSKRKTGDEIEKLIKLMPNTVTVEREGTQTAIAFADIQVGDVLIVKQGDYVPVDGIIFEGHAFVDRAAITGESMPVEVGVNDRLTSADIVKSGFIKLKAEKVGADTTLSQIVKMVKNAGASKAPLQKLADKMSSFFVPTVLILSLITFIIWFSVTGDLAMAANYGICVLVISCPCSLGLATPVAVMAATGRGMALGILFKDAEALQKAKDINCVLLDKTATLTVGKLQVIDEQIFIKDDNFVYTLAVSMEERSNHPIAECIRGHITAKVDVNSIEIDDYTYEMGKGAKCSCGGKVYSLGNRRLLGNIQEKTTYSIEKEYAKKGKTAIFLAAETQILAVFAVADSKSNAKALADKVKNEYPDCSVWTAETAPSGCIIL